MTQEEAKNILGNDFIGSEEINSISDKTNISVTSLDIPVIPFSTEVLNELTGNYVLILGMNKDKNGNLLTLNQMRDFFGIDPVAQEPCFYNQDWYLKEDFASKTTLDLKWYLVSKKVVEDTRGKDPKEIKQNLSESQEFPLAILTAYTFFLYYFLNGEKLWVNDFIWCSDTDHNGDIIYTGRYEDPNGVNKNGFNIHRHLAIRPVYGLAPVKVGD